MATGAQFAAAVSTDPRPARAPTTPRAAQSAPQPRRPRSAPRGCASATRPAHTPPTNARRPTLHRGAPFPREKRRAAPGDRNSHRRTPSKNAAEAPATTFLETQRCPPREYAGHGREENRPASPAPRCARWYAPHPATEHPRRGRYEALPPRHLRYAQQL